MVPRGGLIRRERISAVPVCSGTPDRCIAGIHHIPVDKRSESAGRGSGTSRAIIPIRARDPRSAPTREFSVEFIFF